MNYQEILDYIAEKRPNLQVGEEGERLAHAIARALTMQGADRNYLDTAQDIADAITRYIEERSLEGLAVVTLRLDLGLLLRPLVDTDVFEMLALSQTVLVRGVNIQIDAE